MSEENVEVMRRAHEAVNRGDFEGAVANLAPDFEYGSTGKVPGLAGVYRGPEGFKRFLDRLWGEFDDVHQEIDVIIEAADLVLVSVTVTGRGKQSGAEATWSYSQLWTVRDGKIVRGQGFTSKDEALGAAGLSE